jgi:hypothetical protein
VPREPQILRTYDHVHSASASQCQLTGLGMGGSMGACMGVRERGAATHSQPQWLISCQVVNIMLTVPTSPGTIPGPGRGGDLSLPECLADVFAYLSIPWWSLWI